MKSQSYMTRALRARDPRYATILGKLGYDRADVRPAAPLPMSEARHDSVEEMKALRTEYQKLVGRRAFNGWDADTIRTKVAEAKG